MITRNRHISLGKMSDMKYEKIFKRRERKSAKKKYFKFELAI